MRRLMMEKHNWHRAILLSCFFCLANVEVYPHPRRFKRNKIRKKTSLRDAEICVFAKWSCQPLQTLSYFPPARQGCVPPASRMVSAKHWNSSAVSSRGPSQEDRSWPKGMLSYNQYRFSIILPASEEDAWEEDSHSLQPCPTHHLKTPLKWF